VTTLSIQRILKDLHTQLAEAMLREVHQAEEDGLPIPAADKGAIAKFLKDNGITADPAANADIEALQAALRGQASARATKLQDTLESISSEAVEALYTLQ